MYVNMSFYVYHRSNNNQRGGDADCLFTDLVMAVASVKAGAT